MKLKIEKMKFITREYVRANPEKVFLFGDNLVRIGSGGQAGAMRGEPNAFGVATKVGPGPQDEDFFSDADFRLISFVIGGDIRLAVEKAKTLSGVIVIPEDGLGTGLAELDKRAPNIFTDLNNRLTRIELHDF